MTFNPKPSFRWIVESDGACLGNPGPAGFGVVVRDARTMKIIYQCSGYLGSATNNIAEYHGLIHALEEVIKHQWYPVEFRLDSELLVRQIKGDYRVRSPHLIPLYQEAKRLLENIPEWSMQAVPRESNRDADRLARHAARRRTPLSCKSLV